MSERNAISLEEINVIGHKFTKESQIREASRYCVKYGAINLAQGLPDFPAPEALKLAAQQAIALDHNQYADTWGLEPLRVAIAAKMQRDNKITVDPDTEITVCCGATEGLNIALMAIMNAGDRCLIFEPFYENYIPNLATVGGIPEFIMLEAPHWEITREMLDRAFAKGLKAVILNSPANPTGKVWTLSELELLAEYCDRYDVYIITDEIYEYIIYTGAHISMLSLAGIMLGASASIKWNGLGFTLMTYLLICMTFGLRNISSKRFSQIGILAELCKLKWYEYLFCLGILPMLIYVLSWLPHLMMVLKLFSPQSQGWYWFEALGKFFVSSNRNLYLFHTSSGSISTSDHPIHPYCSSAASWAFSMRPMGYYFDSSGNEWRVVQALGNPILWWLSTLSILPIAFWGIWRGYSISIYVLAGYAANYLPWFGVRRCLFIYHYMSSAVFSFMALALAIYWLITQAQFWQRSIGLLLIAAVIISQIFFMPIWLGLPISSQEFYQRIWFLPNVVPGFDWI